MPRVASSADPSVAQGHAAGHLASALDGHGFAQRATSGDNAGTMHDPHTGTWQSKEAFHALQAVAAEALGVQLVLVDADGALAHRRGGVLKAVCPSCRDTLFTPAGFARCDAFYAAVGSAGSPAMGGGCRTEDGCPLGLSARSIGLAGGRRLVASGYRAECAGASADRADPNHDTDAGSPSEIASRSAKRGVPATVGPQALAVLDAVLIACRRLASGPPPPASQDAGSLSPRVRRLRAAIERYAKSDALVLIRGETGSGKHHAARALHDARDPAAPFLRCRIGAIQPELLEATLFGHTRGAFTDAARAAEGLLGAARGGTLVLDEVGELPERAQALLLRLLAERRYRPLGGTRERTLEARLVATTREDLAAQVERGELRPDLYYRFDVLRLEVPALRERIEDLPALVESLALEQGVTAPSLSAEAWRCLQRYAWPGNLHELAAEVTRLSAHVDGEVTPADLSHGIAAAGGFGASGPTPSTMQPITLARAVAALERSMIEEGLARTDGNRSRLAAELGVSRTTLIKRLHRFDLMKR